MRCSSTSRPIGTAAPACGPRGRRSRSRGTGPRRIVASACGRWAGTSRIAAGTRAPATPASRHHGAGRRPTRHAARPRSGVVAVPDRHDGRLPMRRSLLSLLLVLLAAARPAAAVCTAADVMACGSSCWTCSGSTCTLAELLPVTRAACTFDFGARTLVLAGGGFTAGQNAFEIKARGLTVGTSGTLKATGNQATGGGMITLTLGAGGLTVLPGANLIDLTGAKLTPQAGGGTFSVFSDGDITLAGPGIAVDGTTTDAQGGMILLNAGPLSDAAVVASGSITVRANLSATAKTNGSGGTVMLVANGSPTSARIDGEQRLDVTGGANGGPRTPKSRSGTLVGTTSGGPSGCGGCIELATENFGADLTLAVPLFAGAGGLDGAAGEIDISADGRAILRGNIDASAANGCGTLCIAALSDITLDTPAQAIRADGPDGAVDLCAGRDVVLGSPLVSAAATSTLSGYEGGSLCVASGRNITANGPVNVSASGPNAGGMIDVDACRDLSIGGAATLDADGGQGGGSGVRSFCWLAGSASRATPP